VIFQELPNIPVVVMPRTAEEWADHYDRRDARLREQNERVAQQYNQRAKEAWSESRPATINEFCE
jgi:hypothetical protein